MNDKTQNLIWVGKEFTVEEFKQLSLSDMLLNMPRAALTHNDGSAILTMKCQMPRLKLVDGTTISVQASKHHYCSPREDRGPYLSAEVGFPSADPGDLWTQYRDGDGDDAKTAWNTVYGYVPLPLISFFIGAHGGIDSDRTFQNYDFKLR